MRGKLVKRAKAKRADFVLYCKPNIPIALIEAKDNSYGIGDGMQQALDYAETLNIPFVFTSNGDGFVFHDRTGQSAIIGGALRPAGSEPHRHRRHRLLDALLAEVLTPSEDRELRAAE